MGFAVLRRLVDFLEFFSPLVVMVVTVMPAFSSEVLRFVLDDEEGDDDDDGGDDDVNILAKVLEMSFFFP